MTLDDYVRDRTVEDGGCLRWVGYCYNGHPGGTIDGRKVLIRRELWAAKNGPIPPGKIICCTCETPLCVEHLELSSYARLAKRLGALGVMSGPIRSARIAAAKRAGKQARITQDEARTIRVSDETSTVLAGRYGLSVATICRIKRGELRREFTGNVWAGLTHA